MDIQRYLADEPVLAGPPSTTYRIRKFIHRNKVTVIAASVALVVLLVFISGLIGTTAVALQSLRRARIAETESLRQEQIALKDRDKARAAQVLADRNFQKARAAVEDYLQKVAENAELKYRGNFHELRKQLLTAALPYFEEFVHEKSDDPAVRLIKAKPTFAWHEFEPTWASEAALRDHTAARDIFAKLSSEFPTSPDYLRDLARSYHRSGQQLQELGKRSEAETAFLTR